MTLCKDWNKNLSMAQIMGNTCVQDETKLQDALQADLKHWGGRIARNILENKIIVILLDIYGSVNFTVT